MYGVDCLVGVMHMLVCPVCGSDEMRECLPYVKYCLYNVCVCVCVVHLLLWTINCTRFTLHTSKSRIVIISLHSTIKTHMITEHVDINHFRAVCCPLYRPCLWTALQDWT